MHLVLKKRRQQTLRWFIIFPHNIFPHLNFTIEVVDYTQAHLRGGTRGN